jgi:hypothetical protein
MNGGASLSIRHQMNEVTNRMWKSKLLQWQQSLIARLERDLGRSLVADDLPCIGWNDLARTLSVERSPLRQEARSRNLISLVFRSRDYGRIGDG